MAGYLPDIEALAPDDLKGLVLQLLEDVVALKAENAALREEIARLKGLKGPPKLKPSGMEKATEPARAERKAGRRGGKIDRLVIDEERVLKAAVPPGSRFKGYETDVVQELILRPHVIRYRRERWITPDGRTVVAALPAGTVGHFGPELRRFVLAQYHPGQVTGPRIVAHLRDLGMAISKRQVVRLLIAGKEDFLAEAAGVLKSGLESAAWITVDDTGARYKGSNGACTHIGNTDFAWFATTRAKSRLNFLALLRAGATDYVINDEALAYMRGRSLSGLVIARLAGHKSKRLKDQEAWMAHLERLGITRLRVHPDPLKIATEGALWGSVVAHGLLKDAVIVSDDAGQFNVGSHALCWVHAERLIHKLVGFNHRQRQACARIRARVWWFYADLKAYCRDPTPRRKRELQARFERLFTTTGFATLDRLLARLHANKIELLRALERPDIPLHTNGSENDIRCQVTRRKISGGTRSETGRDCRDAFLANENNSGSIHRDPPNGSFQSTPPSTTLSTSSAIFYPAAFSRRFEPRRSLSGIKAGVLPDPDHDPIVPNAAVNVSMPPWVIAGHLPGSHLTDLQRPWRRIRKQADLEEVRIHDLRHSFAGCESRMAVMSAAWFVEFRQRLPWLLHVD